MFSGLFFQSGIGVATPAVNGNLFTSVSEVCISHCCPQSPPLSFFLVKLSPSFFLVKLYISPIAVPKFFSCEAVHIAVPQVLPMSFYPVVCHINTKVEL